MAAGPDETSGGLGKGGDRPRRTRRPALQAQVRADVRTHEGQAAAVRPDERRDALQHAPLGGRVLDDLGLEVRGRHRPFHLYPRNGARAGAATLRHQSHGTHVHSRDRRRHPAEAVPDRCAGRRASRLAGPLWGLGAALVVYAVYRVTNVEVWGGIAHFGAWVNLFNLLPVWQLDGARGFRALTRRQRWIAVAVIAVMWFATAEGLLVLLGVAAAATLGFGRAADEPDHTALLQYAFLVGVLSLMTRIAVPATRP